MVGRATFAILNEHLFHALREGRLARALWPLQSDEKRRVRRGSANWEVGMDV
jgi:hypothetical protein